MNDTFHTIPIVDTNSKVTVYQGLEGLWEITRHSLETKELLIYETSYASLNDMFPREKAEDVRKEFLRRGVKIMEITNKAYQEEFTELKEFDKQCMSYRYIDPQKLMMTMDFLIFNDTVAFYSLKDPIYGIEVIDQKFADMQRQIFQFVWNSGDLPIIGTNGRSSLF